MPMTPDFSDFSEDELQDVISAAQRKLDRIQKDRLSEKQTGSSGSRGQEVRDLEHGVIAAPTPNEVERVAALHGVPLQYPNKEIDQNDLDRAGRAIDEGLSYARATTPSSDGGGAGDTRQCDGNLGRERNVPRAG